MWLLIAFIAVPLIEIGLFIQIGGAIGLWPTLLIVVLTAIAGTILVRSQGLQAIARLRQSLDRLEDPSKPLAHGGLILFSGALLLTPGFFTDAVGFSLLVPAIRDAVIGQLSRRVKVARFRVGGQERPQGGMRDPRQPPPGGSGAAPERHPARGEVIDADYTEVDPDSVEPRRTARPSGWTRH